MKEEKFIKSEKIKHAFKYNSKYLNQLFKSSDLLSHAMEHDFKKPLERILKTRHGLETQLLSTKLLKLNINCINENPEYGDHYLLCGGMDYEVDVEFEVVFIDNNI